METLTTSVLPQFQSSPKRQIVDQDRERELHLFRTRSVRLSGNSIQEKRAQVLQYFLKTYEVYEELFKVIKSNEAYYIKAEPLRHPLIFYYGHTAVVYVNKLLISGILNHRVNPQMESMMAVGVDEMSWDDLNDSHYDWPTVDQVTAYRAQVKALMCQIISNLQINLPIAWEDPFWTVLMGIEHDRIHLETSAVIIRRVPIEYLHSESSMWPVCPLQKYSGYLSNTSTSIFEPKLDENFPKNQLLAVKGGEVILGIKNDDVYGWDCEYGYQKSKVKDFKASKFLVSNLEFLEFVQEAGYDNEKYWTEEGWKWNRSTQMKHPLWWIEEKDEKRFSTCSADSEDSEAHSTSPIQSRRLTSSKNYKYRTMMNIIEMPWDWPVEVNYLEAKAFCNWKTAEKGISIRLPSEEEYYIMRDFIEKDATEWEFGRAGNINLEKWASSSPVNLFESKGFYDIVGNVWQHSETTMDSFEGFRVHPSYDDFSTPTFDVKHNMIQGGSWISTGNLAIRAARYAFRRHFYQFAGFRYVESDEIIVNKTQLYETDQLSSMYLELHYAKNKYFGVENWPVTCSQVCLDVCREQKSKMKKALDIGCAVGRCAFELSPHFEQVVGGDLSARFFQLAVRLKDFGSLKYTIKEQGNIGEEREINLESYPFFKYLDRTQFIQQDAHNMDLNKLFDFDLIFAGNLIDRMKKPRVFLSQIHKHLCDDGIFVLASPYTWLTEFTKEEEWVGGFREFGEIKNGYLGVKEILLENFEEIQKPMDVQFVCRKTQRVFEHCVSNFTFWKKISQK